MVWIEQDNAITCLRKSLLMHDIPCMNKSKDVLANCSIFLTKSSIVAV